MPRQPPPDATTLDRLLKRLAREVHELAQALSHTEQQLYVLLAPQVEAIVLRKTKGWSLEERRDLVADNVAALVVKLRRGAYKEQEGARFKTWLHWVVCRRFVDAIRSRTTRGRYEAPRRVVDDQEHLIGAVVDPSFEHGVDPLDRARNARRIEALEELRGWLAGPLGALSARDRMVVLGSLVLDVQDVELAKLLGMTKDNVQQVRSRVSRALTSPNHDDSN